jgi:hypothetical protein
MQIADRDTSHGGEQQRSEFFQFDKKNLIVHSLREVFEKGQTSWELERLLNKKSHDLLYHKKDT